MFHRIAIVGFGLIGGSVALAARRRWPGCGVVAIDRPAVVEHALRVGAADQGGDGIDLAGGADLVLLAAPVRQNMALLDRLAGCVSDGALVSDVGGTKSAIVGAARALAPRLTFLGGHPLAGAASAGLGAARADLFDGRPWILTPDTGTADEDLARLEAFASGLGALPKTMTPGAHDTLMAYLSHLPQVAVSALMHVVGEHAGDGGLDLAGQGLRDTTRLAASPAVTWRDVLATNTEAVSAAIDDLTVALQRLKDDLREGAELQRTFDSANQWKLRLDRSARETTST
jgi:prephenate dehydrogenase